MILKNKDFPCPHCGKPVPNPIWRSRAEYARKYRAKHRADVGAKRVHSPRPLTCEKCQKPAAKLVHVQGMLVCEKCL